MPTFAEAEAALKARGYTDANVEEKLAQPHLRRPQLRRAPRPPPLQLARRPARRSHCPPPRLPEESLAALAPFIIHHSSLRKAPFPKAPRP